MLTVFLCDDNQGFLDQYKIILENIAERESLPIQVKCFQSGAAMLFYMEEARLCADIIYLDILMDGENGIQVAARLRELGCNAEIIFLTANPQFVFESFDVSPMHYILKGDISAKRFEEIFMKSAAQAKKAIEEVFVCANGASTKRIAYKEIYYFEVTNRIITVHYGDEEFSFYMKMDELEKKLREKSFIRIHRSYLVHIPSIEQISRDSVTLITNTVLPLGGTYSKTVKAALNQYLSLLHK